VAKGAREEVFDKAQVKTPTKQQVILNSSLCCKRVGRFFF
jgi:hypothetical protein